MYITKRQSLWITSLTFLVFGGVTVYSMQGSNVPAPDFTNETPTQTTAVETNAAETNTTGINTAQPENVEKSAAKSDPARIPNEGSNKSEQLTAQTNGETPSAEASSEGGPISLTNFHRSETKDGKKLWEIKAETGSFLPTKGAVSIENAKLWLFKKKGEVVELQAKKAIVYIRGATLSKAEASEHVVVINSDGTVMTTKEAVYDRVNETVTAPGYVEIENETFKTTGYVLDANVKTESFTLSRDVTTMIKPKKEK